MVNSSTRTTAPIDEKTVQHGRLQRLLAQTQGEVETCRTRAKKAEHELKLVSVSITIYSDLIYAEAAEGTAAAAAAAEVHRLTSFPVCVTARDAHPRVSSRSAQWRRTRVALARAAMCFLSINILRHLHATYTLHVFGAMFSSKSAVHKEE